jgi:riboflavin kinase/FMN adenylyltransferase
VKQPPSSSASRRANPEIRVFPEGVELEESAFRSPLHLAVGMFDGVHIGHQLVIRQAIEAARSAKDHFAGVLTFDPHPSRILYPERATALLMPLSRRIHRMLEIGADHVFVQAFSKSYARREAISFVPSLKSDFPGLESLHVGENFRFGAGRSGDVDTLQKSAAEAGVKVHSHGRKDFMGEPVSSSRIRKSLAAGQMEAVNTMLGSAYSIEGKVIPGRGLGRGIGFPTLNIPWNPEAAPRFGVYRVSLRAGFSGQWFPGIANFGVRPTVSESNEPILEVHLLEKGSVSAADMRQVEVKMLEFIRPEQTFPSIEALRKQIKADVETVRQSAS